jgi:anaerobic ribonucleoside-triphosphate reductase activating protein
MMTKIRVHDHWFGECPLLGPSLYVWVQGCPRRCPGCFNEETLDFGGPSTPMSPAEVAALTLRSGGGLVISGGEPFSQAGPLAEACHLVRAERPDTLILTYTGFLLEQLARGRRADYIRLLKEIDVLVDGPFVRERTTNFPLAGSDNQRVFFLSGRVPPGRWAQLSRSHVQIAITTDKRMRLVGSGGAGLDMHTLVERLSMAGIELQA